MAEPSRVVVRLTATGLAVVLVLQAVWVLAPELVRTTALVTPSSAPVSPDRLGKAAALAMVRGDLWSDYANSLAGESGKAGAATDAPSLRKIAINAITLSPHESRVWLILANLDFQQDGPGARSAEALKMSYYTGPNDAALMPARLRLALRSNAIGDDELRELVTQDIRTLASRQPLLNASLVSAHRSASADGKALMEATIGETDKSLLAEILAGSPADPAPPAQ